MSSAIRGRLPMAVACAALAASFLGGSAASAAARPVFHPRVGHALGLIPPVNKEGDFNTQPTEEGVSTQVLYHGGPVMNEGVTVHTIFWAPQSEGYSFPGSPGAGVPSYTELIEQFYEDVSAESGSPSAACETTEECDIFTTLTQYGDDLGGAVKSGKYEINYDSASDAIVDEKPYVEECHSPLNARACVTDEEVQREVNEYAKVHDERGLTNLWFVFLPPNVDECISTNVCGTNAFAGYHSDLNLGEGVTVYAVAIDPIIEVGSISQGADPEGNPEAESTLDVAGHETNEAMTDPEGTGWMDPNGWEVADKCEFGPQHGTPLGFAPDGSPYNQLIDGKEYLLQEIWSDDEESCVQGTKATTVELPLPQVELTQFSKKISGDTGTAFGGTVTVLLERRSAGGQTEIVSAAETTASGGKWKVELMRAVGDDRDQIEISYGTGTGQPFPARQFIRTGNGGNPFTESGWTGWSDLDYGVALEEPSTLKIGPCFQTGVLSYDYEGTEVGAEDTPGSGSPTEFCSTSTDWATVSLASGFKLASSTLSVSSNDNRTFVPETSEEPNELGGLVKLTVPFTGEPEALPSLASLLPEFRPSGFPTCSANLSTQTVTCKGLVEEASGYKLTDGLLSETGESNDEGVLTLPLAVKEGDTVTLEDAAGRLLTTLHVAKLKVHIEGDSEKVASGSCEPDEYWGGPLTSEPTNLFAGEPSSASKGGVTLTGEICPASGKAEGMPTSEIAQTDELSGGETVVQVPNLANSSPVEGETVSGSFTALAEASEEGKAPIELAIAPASGGSDVFNSSNVNANTTAGAEVKNLTPGTYKATWTVTDANGDTRTVTTRFVEQAAAQGTEGKEGPEGKAGAEGKAGPEGKQGPEGKAGSEGKAGAEGKRGPEGKAGAAAPKPSVSCKLTGKKHDKITCTVSYPTTVKGTLHLSIARGAHVAALGKASLKHGAATVTMRELRRLRGGAWTLTLVLSAAHQSARTSTVSVHVK